MLRPAPGPAAVVAAARSIRSACLPVGRFWPVRSEPITGAAGQAALGLTRLLGLARGIVADSTAEAAKDFDAARWLGRWIERPQPALGGRKPADLIATPTGLEMVARLLGAIESGAYQ